MSEAIPGALLPHVTSLMRATRSLILQCLVDELLQRGLDALALRGGLLHQDEEQVLLAVDDKIAAAGAVPFQFAERAGRRRFGIAGVGADAEAEPEAEPVA